ncbi:MAG: carboxylating nicotinate-nucleotide diphosphorylase [bacterium]
MDLNWKDIDPIIEAGLREDGADADVTTSSLFDIRESGRAVIRTKEDGVVAGLPVAERVFLKLDAAVRFVAKASDGDRVAAGQVLAELEGPKRALLSGERLAVNLLQRMSGIATLAAEYVKEVEGLPVKILDTRKTVPGLRALDKYAVRAGGATNHRMSLSDLIMIKDNHITFAGGIRKAVETIRKKDRKTRIEVETSSLDDVREALAAGADIIMLDNMSIPAMSEAVRGAKGKARIEASGSVRLDNVREIAETGVDFISVGALTHSVRALDISMKVA